MSLGTDYMPTRAEDQEQQSLKFRTYVNYLSNLRLYLESEYSDPQDIIARVVDDPTFKRIQGGKCRDPNGVQVLLRNAWFTELQIRLVAAYEDMIPYSNHWAPVQLYYSSYLAARALFLAGGRDVGTQHTPTLRALSGEIRSRPGLFPYPWKLLCDGDPEKGSVRHYPLPDEVEIKQISGLEKFPSFWDSFGMLLKTTRHRQLRRSIDDWKRRERRKRIDTPTRKKLATKLPPTSIFDALYRLRVRSNYSDADTFLLSLENNREAFEFHRALSTLGCYTMCVFELLIAAHVGKRNYDRWTKDFERFDVAGHSRGTLLRRWLMISNQI